MAIVDDQALVRLGSLGDADAITILYERFRQPVYRVAMRITGLEADAEDVVQDLFCALPRALGTFKGRGSLEGWVKKIAARYALMRLRSRERRREVSLVWITGERAVEPSVAERMTLEAAIAELPDHLRVVYVLKEVEGFGHDEVAQMLDISSGTCRARLHRARAKLRTFLEGSR